MKRLIQLWILWVITCIMIIISNALKAQAIVDPLLQKELQNEKSLLAPLQIIVTFNGNGAATPAQLNILKGLGIANGISLRSFPMAGVLATPLQVTLLGKRPEIKSIYLNRRLEYYNDYSTEMTGVDRMRADPTIIANNNGVPVTGNGVGVLINDSGVDGTNADIQYGDHLVQNVLGTLNLVNILGILPPVYLEGVISTDINSGHGTHCAGTVGGTGQLSSGKYEGVAPGADLIGYGTGAVLLILDALGGLDYAAVKQEEYGIRVVNNSWGGSGAFDPNDPVNLATKILYDRGITTVFAAGNEGPSAATLNTYALAPWVISVAAGDRNRQLADFSSRGVLNDQTTFTIDGEVWVSENRPTITAPGVDIVSTKALSPLPLLSTPDDINNLDPAHLPYYTHMSGTSMAAPHVAGIVALMLEANPSLTPAEIKDILQFTSQPMENYATWEAGWGFVDAYNAVNYAFFAGQQRTNATATTPATRRDVQPVTTSYELTGYPNPFASTLTISYTLPHNGPVNLSLFDRQGSKIVTLIDGEYKEQGTHQVSLEKAGLNLSPGIYVAKLYAGRNVNTLKVIVKD